MTKKMFEFDKLDDGWELAKYNYNDDPRITSVEIPEKYKFKKVKSIGPKAFRSASFLKSVHIPDTVTNIGMSAFEYCECLNELRLPSNLKIVDYCCFKFCTSLKKITLPAKCAVIRSFAFSHCTSLETVELSEMMCVIYNGAFEDCVVLHNVRFPESEVTILGKAFGNCPLLSTDCAMYSLIGTNDMSKPFSPEHMDWNAAMRSDVFQNACRLGSFKNISKTEIFRRLIDGDMICQMPFAEPMLSDDILTELIDYSGERGKTEFTARLINFKNGKNSVVEDIIDSRFSL